MKLEDILSEWKTDSKIDVLELSKEGQRVYELHGKYLDIWIHERLILKKIELEERRLKLQKHEFYTQGASKETKEKGWALPAIGKIMRPDLPIYTDADAELQEMTERIEIQKAKVDALKMILDTINQRTFLLNGMIKREIFMGGM